MADEAAGLTTRTVARLLGLTYQSRGWVQNQKPGGDAGRVEGRAMIRITEAVLRRLKYEVSLVRLCRKRGVALRRTAVAGQLAGRCPFPECRKPALVVVAGKNLFHCTECRAGGGALDFVVKLDGCDYRAATQALLAALPEIREPARAGRSGVAKGGDYAPAA